jgi:hypothetical protein
MPASGLIIEGIEKYFPVPQSCCRAWLNPFAPLTHPALLGVSFEVGADEVAAENRQLKHTVAELLLDKRALQAVVSKKW